MKVLTNNEESQKELYTFDKYVDLHFSVWRALYLPEVQILVLSDLHLGKSGHFQQHGAAVPDQHHAEDLYRLKLAINYFKPDTVLINGDLFHAGLTRDVATFSTFLKELNELDKKTILVRGNHDLFSKQWYLDLGFTEVYEFYAEGRYGFIHKPEDENTLTKLNEVDTYIFGHVHTGVKLKGLGGQRLRFAAYAIDLESDKRKVYLPAFGRLTGLKIMDLKKNRSFALIAEGKVFAFNP